MVAGSGEGRVERKRESSKDNFERKDGKKRTRMKSPLRYILRLINFRKMLRIQKLIPLKLCMPEFPLERLHVPQFDDLSCDSKALFFKAAISAMNC